MRYFFILIILFLIFSRAQAAVLFIKPVKPSLVAGEQFSVQVLLDTEQQPVNTFDIEIIYNNDLLKFIGHKDNNELNILWVNKPKENEKGIIFSGVIPGGVSGVYNSSLKKLDNLKLVELVFMPIKIGETSMEIYRAQILKNDGLGTRLPISVLPVSLKITESISEISNSKDSNPPTDFEFLYIDSQPKIKTPSMLYFNARDDSGISNFYIKNKGEWKTVSSPYPVKKPLLSKTLFFKVEDLHGNFTESEFVLPGNITPSIVLFATTLLILAGFYSRKLLK